LVLLKKVINLLIEREDPDILRFNKRKELIDAVNNASKAIKDWRVLMQAKHEYDQLMPIFTQEEQRRLMPSGPISAKEKAKIEKQAIEAAHQRAVNATGFDPRNKQLAMQATQKYGDKLQVALDKGLKDLRLAGIEHPLLTVSKIRKIDKALKGEDVDVPVDYPSEEEASTAPLPVNSIRSNEFYFWNEFDDIDLPSLGFKSKDAAKKNKSSNLKDVGPGEERLAVLIGAKAQGPATSFDLVTVATDKNSGKKKVTKINNDDSSGSLFTQDARGRYHKWEVKAIGGEEGKGDLDFPVSKKGVVAAKDFITAVVRASYQVENFARGIVQGGMVSIEVPRQHKRRTVRVYRLLLGNVDPSTLSDEDIDELQKQSGAVIMAINNAQDVRNGLKVGEASRGVLNAFYNSAENMLKIAKSWLISLPKDVIRSSNIPFLGNRQFHLRAGDDWKTLRNYVKHVAKDEYERMQDSLHGDRDVDEFEKGLSDEIRRYPSVNDYIKARVSEFDNMDVNVARRLVMLTLHKHDLEAFKDAVDVEFGEGGISMGKELEKHFDVMKAFKGVDGVFLVSHLGFMLIRKEHIPQAFSFYRYTRNRPMLTISNDILKAMHFNVN
jgi:hypothetical protein